VKLIKKSLSTSFLNRSYRSSTHLWSSFKCV